MVLVSNEWQSNKDDDQKSSLAAANTSSTTSTISTPATEEAAADALVAVNNVSYTVTDISLNSSDQVLTARPSPAVDISKRQLRINKKALSIMELNRKTEQEQLLLREKHGTETCEPIENINNSNSNSNINSNINSSDANDNLENQENNNTTLPSTEICDSNTNTLQVEIGVLQIILYAGNNIETIIG